MWLGCFIGDASEWPEGAELNDLFLIEDNGPMAPLSEISFWDVPAERAPSRLAELLHTGLAHSLPRAAHVDAAVKLGEDLVTFMGPSATWRISEEEWSTGPDGGKSKVASDVVDATFSTLLIGRSEHDVLVLVAVDED